MYHCDDTKVSPDDHNNCPNIKLVFRLEELYIHLCFFASISNLCSNMLPTNTGLDSLMMFVCD